MLVSPTGGGDTSSDSPEQGAVLEFTAVFRKVSQGYVGFLEELPGANTQGSTLEEARRNLSEAAELVLEANRALAEEDLEIPSR